jgi:hypothetical protein
VSGWKRGHRARQRRALRRARNRGLHATDIVRGVKRFLEVTGIHAAASYDDRAYELAREAAHAARQVSL